MKISFLVVKNINKGGGIEKYTLELGSRLVKKGHQVTVYSMKHYGDIETVVNGMNVVPVPCLHFSSLEKTSAAFAATLKEIIKKQHDILHFHTIPAGIFLKLPKLLGRKCVLQWHGLEWKRSRFSSINCKLAYGMEKMVMRNDICFTAVSHVQCEYFLDRYGKEIQYIPSGVEIKQVPDPKKIRDLALEPREYILFASRLVREKGAHYLISAFKKIATDCKLVIAGDVKGEQKYKSYLRELAGDNSRIIFPGFVNGRLLEELFGHALFYTQPSEIEGLSIALLEAMSYGCPCLVSDIPENLEAIGDVGWSFNSENINDLSDKLAWMLENSSSIAQAKERGIERVRENYCWDDITTQFEQFYQKVLDDK